MKKKYKNVGLIASLIGLIIIVGFAIIYSVFYLSSEAQYNITVTEKERITKSDTSYYLVWGTDENGNELVFKNDDCLIKGKFNSSDLQGKLKKGNTYTVTVIGWRIPFLSEYENIIEITEDK